ncbi:MAG: immunity 17 family protein [Bacteroidaceae bacterium]|nr:immunity 17 family protein [Bacteroidaceae bacterium]
MIAHYIIQAIFLLVGLTALLASLFDWEWFFTTENIRFLVKKFKREGARWIYGIIGMLFIAAAIYFFIQIKSVN